MADGNGDAPASEKKPRIKLPKGYDSEESFLSEMRKRFNDDWTTDFLNIQAGLEDAAFLAGQQWDTVNVQRRAANRKPILTFNRLPAFVGQVIGNRRLNETVVRVLPDNGGTKAVARIRQGLIRSIEKTSKAERAYDDALLQCVTSGVGNFRLVADYANYDAFEQDLKIESLPDFTAVVWDRLMIDPTGKDATRCFVQDRIPTQEFQRRWPWAQSTELGGDLTLMTQLVATEWFTQDTVRVVSYWRMCHDTRTVALMNDGRVEDVTEKDPREYLPNVVAHPVSGEPYMREAKRPYAEMYLCSATNILAGPYRMYTYRIPVFRVPGWEINVAGSKQRFGLIRWLKDPQRLFNYWRSIQAEKLMMSPKATWIATKKAVNGLEEKWRNAHNTEDPLLLWNDEETDKEPKRVDPVQMEPALIQESQQLSQDLRDISNIHEASLGQQSNEVSGKAINARQRVGELGTVIYHDNLNMAIEECGAVMCDVIPRFYDTPRVVKVLGEDGKEDLQFINNPDDKESDITVGKYSVTLTTGPSYATKRVEAVETLTSLVNSAPEVMAVGMDIIVDNMDLPGAEELAKRLKMNLPPGMRDEDDMTDAEKEQMALAQQESQEQSQLAKENAMLVNQKLGAEAEAASARAEQSRAAAQTAFMQAEVAMRQAGKTDAEIEQIMATVRKTDAETDKLRVETGNIDADTTLKEADTHRTMAETDSIRVNDVLEAQRVENEKQAQKEKAANDRRAATAKRSAKPGSAGRK